MIEFHNVTKSYPDGTHALQNASFSIEPGEFVSIVGQSGAGKTTVARLIIAEEFASKGKVVIGGWDITNIKHRQIPVLRRQIGVVFQDFKLLQRKTVYENVAFGLEVCGTTPEKIAKIVPQVLKIVGLQGKAEKFPEQLSGGEQQRVVIARSLVHRPKILLADEPTGNLDTITANEIIDLLLKINQLGTTVVMVTHNPDIVNRLQKRVITIEKGKIIADKQKGSYHL